MNTTNAITEQFYSWEDIYSGIYIQNNGKNISDPEGEEYEETLMEILGLDGERPLPDSPCTNPRPIIQINKNITPILYDITDIQNYYIGMQV
jgi:hypothetical protein